jgi:hypothetical protein
MPGFGTRGGTPGDERGGEKYVNMWHFHFASVVDEILGSAFCVFFDSLAPG